MKKITILAIFTVLALNANTQVDNQKNNGGMEKVYEFIKKCKTYYIATSENVTTNVNGQTVTVSQPRVRPFGTINLFENKLYIQTGKKKRIAKQLADNPKAELCCFDGSKWVRLSGELIPDERIEAKKSMLDAYPELRGMYNENDDNTIVYYFKSATAYISSFSAKDEEIHF